MAASAHLLLSALSKPGSAPGIPAQPDPVADRDPAPFCVFSAESACAETPLTSEPPLPDAEPLTSEPPMADAAPLTSESDAGADPTYPRP
ncbi:MULTISPECIES: hypothetical protein [Streptomyces]|uniref:Secreted protein n=2 Tax=Streptomyces TaxID=1883 RepID=A0A2U9P1D3_STRAS|nr:MULTISPECIES: hypothetical protein [Streptomyces]AWT43293.1 hypothetical protein DMT42_13820 [Streptomyces actuosus]MBM4824546.1 hypothetical protein [Streptomyces actuosus]GHF68826.1 hypothetical protein GCM10018783_42780 [Streptomyces griseosporeus]